MQTIDICPVCKSKNIEQLTGALLGDFGNDTFRFGAGSYCKDCGVKFQYNTPRLKEILEKEAKLVSDMLKNKKTKSK